MLALFAALKKVVSWYDLLFLGESYMKWAVYFLGIVSPCSQQIVHDLCRRFELPPRLMSLFTRERLAAEQTLRAFDKQLPRENSLIFRSLVGHRIELILYMMAATRSEEVRKAISQYCVHLRFVRPALKGKDLRMLGLTPGPRYREILETLLNEKLNGHIETREEEIMLARRLIAAGG
jgi:tRNA nucleotidyltransferase (CCA-adding enzyme)